MIGVLTTVTASGEQENDLPHGLIADYYTPLTWLPSALLEIQNHQPH